MGTWGTGIFDDDLASDVRGDWREAIQDGASPTDATDELIARYADAIADPDDAPRFWFALAASQTASGRLVEAVRDQALAIIQQGGDIASFAAKDPRLGRKRELMLRKLAGDLTGVQRPPTRTLRPRPQVSPVAIGDVLQVRAENGERTALFVVTALADGYPRGSTWPVLATLAWDSPDIPPVDKLARLPLLRDKPLAFPDRGSVVDLHIVNGPSRGPRAFANFGVVVARGIHRLDAPDHRLAGVPGAGREAPNVGYVTWETLSTWVGGEWYARCLALTAEASKSRAPRWFRRR